MLQEPLLHTWSQVIHRVARNAKKKSTLRSGNATRSAIYIQWTSLRAMFIFMYEGVRISIVLVKCAMHRAVARSRMSRCTTKTRTLRMRASPISSRLYPSCDLSSSPPGLPFSLPSALFAFCAHVSCARAFCGGGASLSLFTAISFIIT